jgi:tetratricopeptide (TPR) repeat protein
MAFRTGAGRYAAGDLAGAAESFEAARRAAPAFADAHAWAGRVALERGDPAAAVVAFAAAVELRPDDEGFRYFLRLAETQVSFGIEAGRAFFAGLSAYEVGDAETAAAHFERAVAANDGFTEAWAWLGRMRQELGRLAAAERAWARVVDLDPTDRRASDFLNLLRQQLAYGAGDDDPTANAFAAGVAAFERADFATARDRFQAVAAADPDAGLAWAWLGRLAYTQRDFEAAALAYERAARLLPDDEDVAWFAEDSAWRAGWLDDDPTEETEDVTDPVDEVAPDVGGGR